VFIPVSCFFHVCFLTIEPPTAFHPQAQGIENISTKISQLGNVEGLPTLESDEPEVVEWRGAIEGIVDANLAGPAEMLDSFAEFSWLLAADETDFATDWREAEHSLAETEAEIARLAEMAERVRAKAHRVVNFRLIQVRHRLDLNPHNVTRHISKLRLRRSPCARAKVADATIFFHPQFASFTMCWTTRVSSAIEKLPIATML
jgi:hypothetical protein